MAPHRILYVIGQLGVGGAERQLVYLATHLDRSRFEPIVCSLSADTALAGDLHEAGVELVVLPKRVNPDITRLWRVFQVARRYRPALIHSYLFVANTWARTAGILCRVPVIVSERSVQGNGKRIHSLVNRLLAPTTALMVANSYAGGESVVGSGAITPDRLAVVHNGISLEPFSRPSERLRIREELGIGRFEPVVGIVGRLAEVKDHATFFAAMNSVAQKVPEIRILCVGDGPLRESLCERVAQLGLCDRTIFTGTRSDIPAIMSALDVLVLSSRCEALPNVVMEGMAAGRPVVATRVGDVDKLVLHGETGLVVPPGCSDAIAAAVVSLFGDPSLASDMGSRARSRIKCHFALDSMVKNTQGLYNNLLVHEPGDSVNTSASLLSK